MSLNQLVTVPNLGAEFDIGVVEASKIRVLLDQIAYDNGISALTATDAQAAIDEIALGLAGVAHTVITSVDLRPTANPNEFEVVIEWTDGDGNPQTSTDPTPITIAQTVATSASAGNLLTEDTGSFIDSATICQSVTDDCLEDCPVTDAFGVLIGTVQQLQ